MKPFVTPDTLKFTNHHLPITKSLHFKPSILVFFAASPQKNIDGKNAGHQLSGDVLFQIVTVCGIPDLTSEEGTHPSSCHHAYKCLITNYCNSD